MPDSKTIIETVAEFYGVTPDQLYGESRHKTSAMARNMAIYLLLQTNLTGESIAKIFNRDHTTVFHARKRIEQLIAVIGGSVAGEADYLKRKVGLNGQ